jgi:hypothetical protein
MTTTTDTGALHRGALAEPLAAIAELERAARMLADAVAHEQRLESERPTVRAAIAARLIGTTNERTGKAHSASSADDAAALDPEAIALGYRIIDATQARLLAGAAFDAAKLRARLAVASVEREG